MLLSITDIEFNPETGVADPVGSLRFHVQVCADKRRWPGVSRSGWGVLNTLHWGNPSI